VKAYAAKANRPKQYDTARREIPVAEVAIVCHGCGRRDQAAPEQLGQARNRPGATGATKPADRPRLKINFRFACVEPSVGRPPRGRKTGNQEFLISAAAAACSGGTTSAKRLTS